MSTAKDLGTRHVCWRCEAKFYDLNRPSPSCPKCGADPRERPTPKAVSKAAQADEPSKGKAAEVDEEEDLDDEDFDDLDDDAGLDDDEDDDIF